MHSSPSTVALFRYVGPRTTFPPLYFVHIAASQYTLGVLPTAQQLLNSSMIRDSPGWVVSGTDCDVSPYCKVNEAVNASCTLLADGDPNSNTQFLQSYPGAVVLYDRDSNASASGGGVPPKQTASIMWCVCSAVYTKRACAGGVLVF